MLEPPRHVKAMSKVGVGPPFPLFEKKNVLFFSFIEEMKFNTWGLFNLPGHQLWSAIKKFILKQE